MARIDTLNNFLSDVANSIRAKRGTSESIPAKNFDTEIENITTGTDIIGDIVTRYIATNEVISAGSFVEFINKTPTLTPGTEEAIFNNYYAGANPSAVRLTDNKVFIACRASKSLQYLYGVLVSVADGAITINHSLQLSKTTQESTYISATALSADKIYISYGQYYTYGMVVTINDSTIVAGTEVQLTTTSGTFPYKKGTVALSENKVFVSHASSAGIYGMIITINGTSIIAGADTFISSDTIDSPSYQLSVAKLSDGKLVLVYGIVSSSKIYSTIITIKDSTFSCGTFSAKTLTFAQYWTLRIIVLPDDKILLAYRQNGLYGIILTREVNSYSYGTETVISSLTNTGVYPEIGLQLTPDNKIFIAIGSSADDSGNDAYYPIWAFIVKIEGSTITPVSEETQIIFNTEYSSDTIEPITLSEGVIFIACQSGRDGYYLYGTTVTMDLEQVKNTTTSTPDGIAKTSGEGTSTAYTNQIEVYIPKI